MLKKTDVGIMKTKSLRSMRFIEVGYSFEPHQRTSGMIASLESYDHHT